MRKIWICMLVAASVALTAACGDRNPKPGDMANELAYGFVEDLQAEEYEKCLELLQSGRQGELTPDSLASLWLETRRKAGSFTGMSDHYAVTVIGDVHRAEIRRAHTNMTVIYTLDYYIDFDKGHELRAATVETEKPEKPAAYAVPDGIIEENAVVSAASGYPLNGKLTLPVDIPEDMPLPAVVLIHDAGEWDMDGSVFDNKPFKDIAHYLASNGIAVLRYDKLTYAYPDGLDKPYDEIITADIESVYDGIYARVFLREDARIDQNRVFVLGHGRGGSLAAEICDLGDYAGYISMAGSPRNPVELAYDNALYDAALAGETAEAAAALLQGDIDAYLSLAGMEREEAEKANVLGFPGSYLLNIIENPPASYLSLEAPALILQGANDFETYYDRDFEMYKTALAGNPGAVFRLYEGLNHLFMWSTMEKPDIRDYIPEGHVEESVLRDIVVWIMEN
jgi:dienelactone hydrolase